METKEILRGLLKLTEINYKLTTIYITNDEDEIRLRHEYYELQDKINDILEEE